MVATKWQLNFSFSLTHMFAGVQQVSVCCCDCVQSDWTGQAAVHKNTLHLLVILFLSGTHNVCTHLYLPQYVRRFIITNIRKVWSLRATPIPIHSWIICTISPIESQCVATEPVLCCYWFHVHIYSASKHLCTLYVCTVYMLQ